MLEIVQRIGFRDPIVAASLDVFSRKGSPEAEISKVSVVVSKPVSHEQFQSKEELLTTFLKDRHAIWMRWFEKEIEARYHVTGGGLEIIADVLQKGSEDPKCFGLAFINSLAESSAFRRPFAIEREQKEHLRGFLERLALKMGLQHPDMAASAAVLVIERTIAQIQTTGSLRETQTARLLFQCLQHS